MIRVQHDRYDHLAWDNDLGRWWHTLRKDITIMSPHLNDDLWWLLTQEARDWLPD
jgi:hypothetical protein